MSDTPVLEFVTPRKLQVTLYKKWDGCMNGCHTWVEARIEMLGLANDGKWHMAAETPTTITDKFDHITEDNIGELAQTMNLGPDDEVEFELVMEGLQ